MAEQDNFIFRLGADITPFKKSITQVEGELKRVRNELKTKTGQAIVETNAYIQQLEQSLIDLKKVGFTGVAKGAQQGQTALFALGQVARDLPFGFIAIQNNLPLLVDQFVALRQSTGGAGKALGAILNSIAGPAGLAFGFGVLTSAITGLVQEYGSLSNALGQIFGLVSRTKIATEELDKAQIKTRASAIAETQSINNLLEVLNSSKSTYSERLGAYNRLNEIIPDVLSGLDKEKTINGQNKKELDGLIKLKKENIILDGTRQALIKAIEKEAENAFTALAKAQKQDFFGNLGNALKGILKGFPPFIAAQLEAIDQANQSGVAYDYLSEQLGKVDEQLTKNQGVIDQNTEAYKKQQKAIEDATKAKEKQNKEDKRLEDLQFKLINQKKELIDLEELTTRGTFTKSEMEAMRQKFLQQVAILKERQKIEKDLTSQKVTKGFLVDTIEGFKNISGLRIEDTIFNFDRMKAIADTYQKLVQQRFENIKGIVQDTLTQPLTYLFDTVLEGGKISWKELGNIVVEQLKRIAIQITTTAAAVAIADLLTKGGYSASVKLFNKATGIVDRGGTGVSVGRPSAVNFGGIQGGIGLSGQVVFVQRGTDLVGVLNRSNATINRVG